MSLLPKFRVFLVVCFLGLVTSGARVQANDEHVVIILEEAYFPQKTILKEGDVIRFVNESGSVHAVRHADGLWATHPIARGAELLVTIKREMAGAFHGMSARKITGQLDLE